jgi:hypothetical protein
MNQPLVEAPLSRKDVAVLLGGRVSVWQIKNGAIPGLESARLKFKSRKILYCKRKVLLLLQNVGL